MKLYRLLVRGAPGTATRLSGKGKGEGVAGDLFVDERGIVRWLSIEDQQQLSGRGYAGAAAGFELLFVDDTF